MKKKVLLITKDIVVSKIKNIVEQLYETPDTEFSINNLGEIIWKKYNWKTRKFNI